MSDDALIMHLTNKDQLLLHKACYYNEQAQAH